MKYTQRVWKEGSGLVRGSVLVVGGVAVWFWQIAEWLGR